MSGSGVDVAALQAQLEEMGLSPEERPIKLSNLSQPVKWETGNEELVKKYELILFSYKREVPKSSLIYQSRWSAVGTTYVSATSFSSTLIKNLDAHDVAGVSEPFIVMPVPETGGFEKLSLETSRTTDPATNFGALVLNGTTMFMELNTSMTK